MCLVNDKADDDNDDLEEPEDEGEDDFFEAGPLLTPGLRPVCGFLLEGLWREEFVRCADDLEEDLLGVVDDDEEEEDDDVVLLVAVLLMVNFIPSWLDLTIYSLLLPWLLAEDSLTVILLLLLPPPPPPPVLLVFGEL